MAELKTRILVVDDDQRLRDLLVRYLGGEGYEVKAVPDAAGMDKQLARERYDLLVLDLLLPRAGGGDGQAPGTRALRPPRPRPHAAGRGRAVDLPPPAQPGRRPAVGACHH